MFGHVETVPIPVSPFWFSNFKNWAFLKSVFVAGFRVPQPFASVSQLPAALRLPQKKHGPGVLEYVSCGFCHF